ncbi:sensor histidine kinase [Streptomyces sp. NBC_01304]|uniref:sensor histidine kinase n=1 Tax=Streptomyces sp. NBC_01304 TaxID=2903818 RepID=UPI002E139B16|nr:HAMP domain-containing histidine kinase [Streptomyces sp. NBC_01304]
MPGQEGRIPARPALEDRGPGGSVPATSAKEDQPQHRTPRSQRRATRPGKSIRWRLTLLYGGLFVIAGALLLTITYVLVSRAQSTGPRTDSVQLPDELGLPGGEMGFKSVLDEKVAAVRQDQLNDLVVQSGIALGLMAAASLGLGWFMAGRVLAPLRTMTAGARRISADNLHERLAVPGPADELKDLADTFDDLLARLEDAFAAQRQFVANASHELRTPLTLQQAVIDITLADQGADAVDLRAALGRVRAAGQEQERLIDALLTLARSQRGLERREYVDLAVLVRALLPAAGPGVPRVAAELHRAPLLGDPQLIERLVVNLRDNAVRHNSPDPSGSWISLWTGMEAGRPTLRIANSGPMIPADQVDGLFAPFRRLGPDRVRTRDGLGLGLSIVAAVAAAHGGAVRASPRAQGGLNVEVTLPPA